MVLLPEAQHGGAEGRLPRRRPARPLPGPRDRGPRAGARPRADRGRGPQGPPVEQRGRRVGASRS
ncbi:hypothetical protein Ae168Ps1_1166c [Pseudonocardia sp. Ae168_Ps1]|nr:hypothetical protein Ae168Ps1_1166c [Pseudonocardia sp. Ae168_Ps1]